MPKGVTKRARKRAHELAQRAFVIEYQRLVGNANIHYGTPFVVSTTVYLGVCKPNVGHRRGTAT
jgi:hypothetical protein